MDFDWDDSNRNHIALHNVTPEEVEQALLSVTLDLDRHSVDNEERFEQVGQTTAGRTLFIVSIDQNDKLRVVTAFDAGRATKLEFLGYQRSQYDR